MTPVGTVDRTAPGDDLIAEFSPDYADAFRIRARGRHDARAWAARSLKGAEARGGMFATIAWRALLGLRIAPVGTAGTIAGWRVASETPNRILLAAEGGRMSGRMVFDTSGDAVTWTTMLDFHGSTGRRTWAAAGSAHRAMVPRCLVAAELALRQP